jgi:adenosyl cobinamide kinase/adenosyl cobinamide phosphate guanylyltransferase
MSHPLVVILGGTRSGKSRLGRERAVELAGDRGVTYVGTALPGDPELEARIALHRADRPAGWTTVEPGRDVVAAIEAAAAEATILLDGLTLWVSQLVGDEASDAPDVGAIVDGPIESLRAALAAHAGAAIVVSDEVGLGIVPMTAVGRAFRDVLGIAHQRLVADADEAWLTVAGRAFRLDEGRRI